MQSAPTRGIGDCGFRIADCGKRNIHAVRYRSGGMWRLNLARSARRSCHAQINTCQRAPRWHEPMPAGRIGSDSNKGKPVVGNSGQDERFMRAALSEALSAQEAGEVPVGAVVVHDDRVIGRGYNQRELLNDPTALAEMLALTAASAFLGSWRLDGCTLYVTLEPCVMCAGAIVLARVERLVFGATDPKGGACTSLYQIPTDERLNHRVQIGEPVLRDECAALLQAFFAEQRALGKK